MLGPPPLREQRDTASTGHTVTLCTTPKGVEEDAKTPHAKWRKSFYVIEISLPLTGRLTSSVPPNSRPTFSPGKHTTDIYKSGLIINDIARLIEEASVIIADVTTDNPNVFYEVGYAHGIKKATILLSDRTREKLPFDVSASERSSTTTP